MSDAEELPLAPLQRRFWTDRSDWPMDTSRYIFLGSAVIEAGPVICGSEWTGAEPAAVILGELDRDRRGDIVGLLSRYDPDHDPMRPEHWDDYHRAREIAARLDKAAQPLAGRFEKVCREITAACRDGAIDAYLLNSRGGPPRLMPPDRWWARNWRSIFNCCAFTNEVAEVFITTDQVFLDRAMFSRFLEGKASGAPQPLPPVLSGPPPAATPVQSAAPPISDLEREAKLSRVRSKPGQRLVAKAIDALYPEGVPDGLGAGPLDQAVNKWLLDQRLGTVSKSTVERALRKIEPSRH